MCRILVNVFALYGRNLIAILCGVFAGRWLFLSLGEVDYGLYGVVAGLIGFAAIFYQTLTFSTMRFYALGVDVPRWFSASLILHVVIALLIASIGYPLGDYAIRHWLVIPAGRIAACRGVFAFALTGCIAVVVSAPFSAMWTARQKIAELALFGYAQQVLNMLFLYFMAAHPGDWLMRYAAWSAGLLLVVQFCISFVAFQKWDDCRFGIGIKDLMSKAKQLMLFSWWHLFGNLGLIAQIQGVAILANRGFGPKANAAIMAANSASGHVQGLASALQSAYEPVVISLIGQGENERASRVAYRVCRLCAASILIFVVPLLLELHYVLHLWLGQPPACSAELCAFALMCIIFDKLTIGHMMLVNANGRVALYHTVLGFLMVASLPVVWIFMSKGSQLWSVGLVLALFAGLKSIGRVVLTRFLLRVEIYKWVFGVIMPIACLALVAYAVGCLPRFFMREGVLRLAAVIFCAEVVFLPLSWRFLLNQVERDSIKRFMCGLWR